MVFAALEGIVSKRRDCAYATGKCRHWVKTKNPAHPAYSRVRDQLLLLGPENLAPSPKRKVAEQPQPANDWRQPWSETLTSGIATAVSKKHTQSNGLSTYTAAAAGLIIAGNKSLAAIPPRAYDANKDLLK